DRIAEVDQDPVTEQLRDVTTEAPNHGGRGLVIGVDDIAELLGIEGLRQRRRADQIAKQHGQATTLGNLHGRLRETGAALVAELARRRVDRPALVAAHWLDSGGVSKPLFPEYGVGPCDRKRSLDAPLAVRP